MRAKRLLVLRKDTLTELDTTDLAALGGGQQDPPLSRVLCFDIVRPSRNLPICASVFEPCTYGCS